MESRGSGQSQPALGRIQAVDGLRAIAIVAVLLFHYGGHLSGGFLGVDIFLVVSGFVITRLIELQWRRSGAFSFSDFLSRRIRRLFPPLIVMLVGTSAAAWAFFGADDFRQYSGSLATSALGVSNIFFWQTTGYFAPDASDQPLLHTWSLGLEEQFYLVFPFFLLLLLRHLSLRGMMVAVFLSPCVASALQYSQATSRQSQTSTYCRRGLGSSSLERLLLSPRARWTAGNPAQSYFRFWAHF